MTPEQIRDLATVDLKAHWLESFGAPSPKKMRRTTLERILVCEAQWRQSGEGRVAIRQQLERVAASADKNAPSASEGTRLIREWHGTEHVVDVIDGMYHWNGRAWTSLSAIAREITGAKWSGPRFFGVKA
ncbi:DUF2924 domain-containing protein [Hyphomonas sp.]|uniref:DUF2924 domain-containing protein n=1 Tax=Hyphomonas sp. TaxID=87 RepID=UPI0032F09366